MRFEVLYILVLSTDPDPFLVALATPKYSHFLHMPGYFPSLGLHLHCPLCPLFFGLAHLYSSFSTQLRCHLVSQPLPLRLCGVPPTQSPSIFCAPLAVVCFIILNLPAFFHISGPWRYEILSFVPLYFTSWNSGACRSRMIYMDGC